MWAHAEIVPGGVRFRLWAPAANSISVADGTSEAIRMETRMARLSDDEIDRLYQLPLAEFTARAIFFDDLGNSVPAV